MAYGFKLVPLNSIFCIILPCKKMQGNNLVKLDTTISKITELETTRKYFY